MLVRKAALLGSYRFIVAATLALGLVHCGDAESSYSDDLVSDATEESAAGYGDTETESAAGNTNTTGGEVPKATGSTPSPAGLGLTGNWGMFLFEDPVAIRLEQDGDRLSGVGCCIPDLVADQYCCGTITGRIDDDRASFSFPLGDLGDRYRADVVVSEDGTRLGGRFFREDATDSPVLDVKTAWLRYESTRETWLTTYPDLEAELRDISGTTVRLHDSAEAGDGFEHDTDYELLAAHGSLGGDLGAFWGSEIHVRASDGAIVAGPVPTTSPDLPESMILRRDGTTLLEVEVTMGSGASYSFDVVTNAGG